MRNGVDDAAHLKMLRADRRQKFVRWNGYAMAQFTVAIALLSTLSVSAIGAGITLSQHPPISNSGVHSLAFAISMLFFIASILASLSAVISRTLDFRMTARKLRGRLDCTMFGWDDKKFGRVSWFLFWVSTASFFIGVFLFTASICAAFTLQLAGCK